MARVKIVKIPKAQNGIDLGAGASGTNGSRQFALNNLAMSGRMSQEPIEARQTLQAVPRDQANLEAEKGETAVVNMGGMPAHFKIGGKRHSQGGTPLDLPDNSFIFSDTSKMKIKDPIIQAQFGMAFKKGGYTPADIAKKYDINKYRKTLADPDSEDIDRNTAEMMISNYNLKLAKLGLVQESIKGFPQGIPVIAMPYIMTGQIDPSEFLPDQAEEQQEGATQPDADMGTARYGGLPRAQNGYANTWQELLARPGSNNKPISLPETDVVANKPDYTQNFANAFRMKDEKGTPSYEKLINMDPQEPNEPLTIGRGFSGDKALEAKWAKDPNVGPYYRKYKEALRSGHPKTMMDAAEIIENADIGSWDKPNFAWDPVSGQNKLSDFAMILKQEAYRKYEAQKAKVIPEENKDKQLAKKMSDAYTKAWKLKKKAEQENNSDLEIHYDEALIKLQKFHPDYKKEHFWRKENAGILDNISNAYTSVFQNMTDPLGLDVGHTFAIDNKGPIKKLNASKTSGKSILYSAKDDDEIAPLESEYPELFEEKVKENKVEEKKVKKDDGAISDDALNAFEDLQTIDTTKMTNTSMDTKETTSVNKKVATESTKRTERKPLRNWD